MAKSQIKLSRDILLCPLNKRCFICAASDATRNQAKVFLSTGLDWSWSLQATFTVQMLSFQ